MRSNLADTDNVVAALGGPSVADTNQVNRLIASASRLVYAFLQRPNLFQHAYRDVYDGAGRDRQVLRNWPVLSVDSLAVGTAAIPAAPAYGHAGYRLEPWDGFPPGAPQSLILDGFAFSRGSGNVTVTYTAGYAVQNEPHAVPGTTEFSVTVDAPFGTWAVDHGVAYAGGATLAKVASNPAQGQYSVSKGKYTFNSADAARDVLISYSYIPEDIEQAVIDVVCAMNDSLFSGNIKSMKAGDAALERFSPSFVSTDVQALLQPYKSVLGV